MSKKLTPTQINLLNWMNDGNSVSFCTEVSTQLAKISYSTPPPFHLDKRAVTNLKRDGYLEEIEKFIFGIRWSMLTINNKGVALLESLND